MRTRFEVTTPTASPLLASIGEVRLDACIPSTLQDPQVENLVLAASQQIARFLAVQPDQAGTVTLANETCRETWRGKNATARPLRLGRTPVHNLIAVTENGSRSARVIDDGEGGLTDNPAFAYEVRAAAGLLYKLDGAGNRTPWPADVVLVIEYEAGWKTPGDASDSAAPDIPADLRQAVSLTVRRQLSLLEPEEFSRVKAVSFTGIGAWQFETHSVDFERGIASDVAAMLMPYRQFTV